MSDLRLPVPRPDSELAFDPVSPAPFVERDSYWLESAGSTASNWPMFRANPGRTGVQLERDPTLRIDRAGITTTPEDDAPANDWVRDWTLLSDRGYGSFPPAVANKMVFLGTSNGRVLAYDAVTGQPSWTFKGGRQVAHSPVVDGRTLYVICHKDGWKGETLYALGVGTSKVDWSFDLRGTPGGLNSRPIRSEHTICVVDDDGEILGINSNDGSLLWKSVLRATAYQYFMHQSQGTLFVRDKLNHIAAISASTGDVEWVSKERLIEFCTPEIGGGRVIITGADGHFYVYDARTGQVLLRSSDCKWKWAEYLISRDHVYINDCGRLHAINLNSGNEEWSWESETSRFRWPGGKPQVAEGVVYVNGSESGIYAVDVVSGRQKWTVSWDDRIRTRPDVIRVVEDTILCVFVSGCSEIYAHDAASGSFKWKSETLPYLSQIPTVDTSSVYLVTQEDRLVCRDLSTGAERWSVGLRNEVSASPTVAEDMIYAGSHGGTLLPMGPEYGSGWEHQLGSAVTSTAAIAEDTIYVGSEAGALHALAITNGAERWRFATIGAVRSSPAVYDDLVFFGCDGGFLYAVDTARGDKRWVHSRSGAICSSPAFSDGLVFVGADDGSVTAHDMASGSLRWSFQTNGAVRSSPALAAGSLFIGSCDGSLYAMDTHSGAKRWEFSTAGPIHSSPAVLDGIVYFGSDDQRVYAADARSGVERWSTPTKGAVRSSPAVSQQVVCVGSDDGHLYLLDAATGDVVHLVDSRDPVRASPLVVDGSFYITILNGEAWRLRRNSKSVVC